MKNRLLMVSFLLGSFASAADGTLEERVQKLETRMTKVEAAIPTAPSFQADAVVGRGADYINGGECSNFSGSSFETDESISVKIIKKFECPRSSYYMVQADTGRYAIFSAPDITFLKN